MRPTFSVLLQCVLAAWCAASYSGAAWGGPIAWPVSPSRLSLNTPYGTLSVKNSEYIYESKLMINNVNVNPPVQGILNITYAFSLPKAQAALVSINSGSYECPIAYRWIVMTKTSYTISPAFGSCSPEIRVSVRGHRFTLQTPSNQKPNKIDIYTYDGHSIRHRTKP